MLIHHRTKLTRTWSTFWSISWKRSKGSCRRPSRNTNFSKVTMLTFKIKWMCPVRNTSEQLCWWRNSWMTSWLRHPTFLKVIKTCTWTWRRSRTRPLKDLIKKTRWRWSSSSSSSYNPTWVQTTCQQHHLKTWDREAVASIISLNIWHKRK